MDAWICTKISVGGGFWRFQRSGTLKPPVSFNPDSNRSCMREGRITLENIGKGICDEVEVEIDGIHWVQKGHIELFISSRFKQVTNLAGTMNVLHQVLTGKVWRSTVIQLCKGYGSLYFWVSFIELLTTSQIQCGFVQAVAALFNLFKPATYYNFDLIWGNSSRNIHKILSI